MVHNGFKWVPTKVQDGVNTSFRKGSEWANRQGFHTSSAQLSTRSQQRFTTQAWKWGWGRRAQRLEMGVGKYLHCAHTQMVGAVHRGWKWGRGRTWKPVTLRTCATHTNFPRCRPTGWRRAQRLEMVFELSNRRNAGLRVAERSAMVKTIALRTHPSGWRRAQRLELGVGKSMENSYVAHTRKN